MSTNREWIALAYIILTVYRYFYLIGPLPLLLLILLGMLQSLPLVRFQYSWLPDINQDFVHWFGFIVVVLLLFWCCAHSCCIICCKVGDKKGKRQPPLVPVPPGARAPMPCGAPPPTTTELVYGGRSVT